MTITSTFKKRFTAFITHHAQASIASFGRLYRTPFSSFLTLSVIAITLALPTTFFTLLNTMQQFSRHWETGSGVSLFLYKNTTEEQAQKLKARLTDEFHLTNVHYIAPQQGLTLLAQQSGVEELLTGLPNNPLPGVITATPKHKTLDKQHMQNLIARLQQLEDIDSVQVDLAWLERLQAILNLIKQAVIVLTLLLASGVFLIVANTIRHALQHAQREIEIFELIGATQAFIRRPLLYIGFWYGLGSGLLAWVIVNLIILVLQSPAQQIATLYHSQTHLGYFGLLGGAGLCLTTILLGLTAAWIVVRHHLQAQTATSS